MKLYLLLIQNETVFIVNTDNEGLHMYMYPGNSTVCQGIIAAMSHKAYKLQTKSAPFFDHIANAARLNGIRELSSIHHILLFRHHKS